MNTNDAQTLQSASLFRRMRALCRTMRKTVWHFDEKGYIRSHSACPLTFAAYAAGKFDVINALAWSVAGKQLGFSDKETVKIVTAADDPRSLAPDRMRRILLRAANLKEP